MIALALALAIQQPVVMTQDAFVDRGIALGRMAASAGACESAGYEVDRELGVDLAETYAAEAKEAGWPESLAAEAIRTGSDMGAQDLQVRMEVADADDPLLEDKARAAFGWLKAHCHSAAQAYPGLIPDVESGDRNLDARVAIILRPLHE